MTFIYLTIAKLCHSVPLLRRPFWRFVYQFLAHRFEQPDWTFMNYGYVHNEGDPELELKPEDEGNRNLIALYHRVAAAIDLSGKVVLEVGCGRGGGASYVTRYLSPARVEGVDISANVVDFCIKRHPIDRLGFRQADAEALTFEDNSFDAVLNVESSHCYGSIDRFFGEVYRVLRPGGSFLYADFRPKSMTDGIGDGLTTTGFTIQENEEITQNVLAALNQDSEVKKAWINDLDGRHLHSTLQTFAATSGTKLYQEFQRGALVYFRFLALKPCSGA